MSKAIAHFSGGEYSHTSLCVTPQFLFESDGEIIAYRLISNEGSATLHGEKAEFGAIAGNSARCAVYRHPLLSDVDSARFDLALEEEMRESYGKDYAEMYRLVPLARLKPWAKAILDNYFRLEHSIRYHDAIPGPFCSQLVARFYQRL